jgi:hypothetical protein
MALGLTKALASRHDNVPVQDFYLGLDTSGTPMGARLAEGDMSSFSCLKPSSKSGIGVIGHSLDQQAAFTAAGDTTKSIPYNHLVSTDDIAGR